MVRFYLYIFLFPTIVFAQSFEDPDLQSLVDAEWAFIRMAKERNTSDAFYAFLADSAVTFGAEPRIGKKHLVGQAINETWLYWEPVFTDISASGDFGFNTGPWELRENRTSPEAVAFGRFTSVWKKENGQWKVAIDMGIAHPKPIIKDSLVSSSIKLKNISGVAKSLFQKVIAEEQKFIREYATKNISAYAHTLSNEARVYRHQHLPLHGKDILKSNVSRATAFRFIDGEIASSGDLAYVYGKALIEIKEDNGSKKIDSHYMRIWKKEDGKNWKIVLDVLSYL